MLTDAQVRSLKPKEAPYKVSDSGGLFLLIQPNGSRLWRMAYRFNRKQRTAAFGIYPDVSLAEARTRRDETRLQLRAGEDPAEAAKAKKIASITFRAVAEEWREVKVVAEDKAPSTLNLTRWAIGILNDGIGDKPISEIEAPDLLEVLRRVEAAGRHQSATRLRAIASTIFRFGIASGYCKRDPAADLRGVLTSRTSKPHAAVTDPAGVGELMRTIDGYDRVPTLRLALQFLAVTFVRPGELCAAQWSDIEGNVWNVPADRMKMRIAHRVPLSRQAMAILDELRPITGKRAHLFASPIKPTQSLGTQRLNHVLDEIGFEHCRHVAHGFRSMFSTLANESGKWSPDVIEASLAHAPRGVRGIYNRAIYWSERVALAQWYSDYLDELRDRGKVVAMPRIERVRKVGA
jgi:integrase